MTCVSRMAILLLAALVLGGCDRTPSAVAAGAHPDAGGDGAALRGRLVVTGSSTCAPLVAEIAARFEAAHPGVRIDVQSGGSSRGIRDVRSGAADIGMSSRALTDDERAVLTTYLLGWDGVAFVVHADNALADPTRARLRDLFTGRVDRWNRVGGPDAPVVVSTRAAGRSELTIVSDYLGIDPGAIRADVVDGETQQAIKTVAGNRNAIGFVSLGAARHAAAAGLPVRLLPLGGVPAMPEAVRAGTYPLARPLLFVLPSPARGPVVEAFLAYACSPAVDDLIERLAYVPPARDDDG